MKWIEIYKKYKDTELMKEFENYLVCEEFFSYRVKPHNTRHIQNRTEAILSWKNIKDIWGYLIVFAEMKEYGLTIDISSNQQLPRILVIISNLTDKSENIGLIQGFEINEVEKAMLWCTEKFFEVTQ